MNSNEFHKTLKEKFNINDTFETEIVNIVDFGIFERVIDEIDGMVHISDLSWDEKECEKIIQDMKKGDKVKVKILDINAEKERISPDIINGSRRKRISLGSGTDVQTINRLLKQFKMMSKMMKKMSKGKISDEQIPKDILNNLK